MKMQYVYNLKDCSASQPIGNKARALRFLLHHGFRVPKTYVCTWDAYDDIAGNGYAVKKKVAEELSQLLNLRMTYAVRSSTNFEDSDHYSLSGQFTTILNVSGIEDIIQAIECVWQSTRSSAVQLYLEKMDICSSQLKMAVIIQEMARSALAGVVFSKNPISGKDEIIVEAVRGSGENLVQRGVTPIRWVQRLGEWIVCPGEQELSSTPVQQVVSQTKMITRKYGTAVDLEWVYDGKKLYWVQLREITTLASVDVYSNVFSREFLPGIIKPMVWSLNTAMVNSAWLKFFSELIGSITLDVERLAKLFFYRAYFNIGVIDKILESLGLHRGTFDAFFGMQQQGAKKLSFKPNSKTIMLLPRLAGFVLRMIRVAGKIEKFRLCMHQQYKALDVDKLDQLTAGQHLQAIENLIALTKKTAYYNILSHVMMYFYCQMLKLQLRKGGIDFESFDLTGGMDEFRQFDPAGDCKKLHQMYKKLDQNLQNTISRSSYRQFLQLQGIDAFRQSFIRFLEQFGHLSDSSNDFSHTLWHEKPETILAMIIHYSEHRGKISKRYTFEDLHMSRLQHRLTDFLYHKARQFRWYKEAVGFLSTYGYSLFRKYFLALGHCFVKQGWLEHSEDIFYFYFEEVQDIVAKGALSGKYSEQLHIRKREIKDYHNITLPSIIYGDQPPPFEVPHLEIMQGIGASPGYYKGKVRVIKGMQDYHKMQPGDVLVIPYSDIGLTPLFTKAGAVIAESGGMLSHSSIIAREYNIPAVVQLTGACLLKDNTMVSINGYTGEVKVHS